MTQEKINIANNLLAAIKKNKSIIEMFNNNEVNETRQLYYAIDNMSNWERCQVKTFIDQKVSEKVEDLEKELEAL